MTKCIAERNVNKIKILATGKTEVFDSVNKAKKASLKITRQNGLGSILKIK